jgi:hypothetical protein
MEFSTPRDPSGRPCLPTHHRRSRLPLTNSASIPGPCPRRSRVCWSDWPRCPTLAIRAAYRRIEHVTVVDYGDGALARRVGPGQPQEIRCDVCGGPPAAAPQRGPIVPLDLQLYELHWFILVTTRSFRNAFSCHRNDLANADANNGPGRAWKPVDWTPLRGACDQGSTASGGHLWTSPILLVNRRSGVRFPKAARSSKALCDQREGPF